MTKHYYISDPNAEKGFVEVTEEEWTSLIGDEATRPYASAVYRGEMIIDEVPEEVREAVAEIVANKNARFGLYSERELPAQEALDILTGGDS